MPKKTFTTNEEWNTTVPGRMDGGGYRMLSYSGNLGGGTLRVYAMGPDGVKTPVSDSKLSAAKVDDNGDAIQQMTFQTAGNVYVTLSGATAPNVDVVVE